MDGFGIPRKEFNLVNFDAALKNGCSLLPYKNQYWGWMDSLEVICTLAERTGGQLTTPMLVS